MAQSSSMNFGAREEVEVWNHLGDYQSASIAKQAPAWDDQPGEDQPGEGLTGEDQPGEDQPKAASTLLLKLEALLATLPGSSDHHLKSTTRMGRQTDWPLP